MEKYNDNTDRRIHADELRLLNAMGEALGDMPSEDETRKAWLGFNRRHTARRVRRMALLGASAAAAVVFFLIMTVKGGGSASEDFCLVASADAPAEVTINKEHGQVIITTPPATTYSVTLGDGSGVILGSNSRLEYPERFAESGDRVAKLKGEARFTVAKDASRPFIVETGKLRTKVLGTVFDVNAYTDRRMSVTLFEGKVMVSDEENSVSKEMKPGQRAVISEAGKLVLESISHDAAGGWTDGMFNFDNSSLADVMGEVGTWYNLTVRVKSPDILEHRVHFRFSRRAKPSEVLNALTETGVASFTLKGNTITVNEHK